MVAWHGMGGVPSPCQDLRGFIACSFLFNSSLRGTEEALVSFSIPSRDSQRPQSPREFPAREPASPAIFQESERCDDDDEEMEGKGREAPGLRLNLQSFSLSFYIAPILLILLPSFWVLKRYLLFHFISVDTAIGFYGSEEGSRHWMKNLLNSDPSAVCVCVCVTVEVSRQNIYSNVGQIVSPV